MKIMGRADRCEEQEKEIEGVGWGGEESERKKERYIEAFGYLMGSVC